MAGETRSISPEALAAQHGWSPRRVRQLARKLGAFHILDCRMILTPRNVDAILRASRPIPATGFRTTASAPPKQPYVPRDGHIYFLECGGFIKIGYSGNPSARISSIQVGSPLPVKVLCVCPGTLEEEQDIHKRFARLRKSGEWFKSTPGLLAFIDERRRMG